MCARQVFEGGAGVMLRGSQVLELGPCTSCPLQPVTQGEEGACDIKGEQDP